LSAVAWTLLVASAAPAADVRVEGFLDGLAVAATGSGPMQRPQAVGQLSFDSKLRRELLAHLTLRGRVGGPFVGGSGVGFYVLDDMFQNVSPAFEVLEGWLEWRGRKTEVRAGMMRVAWGELDGIPPTDVVNPRGYHDPIVEDPGDCAGLDTGASEAVSATEWIWSPWSFWFCRQSSAVGSPSEP